MHRGIGFWLSRRAELTPHWPALVFEGQSSPYKIPKQVEFVEALPRNAQGKILKRVLRDQLRPVEKPAPVF